MDFAETVAVPDHRLVAAAAISMPMAMRVVVVSMVVTVIARMTVTRFAHGERHKIALRP